MILDEWRPVLGWEDLYLVSTAGQVWSITLGAVLRPSYGSWGHARVTLQRNGQKRDASVHILVLEAFVGPRPDGMWGLHLDDEPGNNSLGNLYWGTPQRNALDRIKNGRHQGRSKNRTTHTHCRRNHEFAVLGVYIDQSDGRRRCAECKRINARRRRAESKKLEVTHG